MKKSIEIDAMEEGVGGDFVIIESLCRVRLQQSYGVQEREETLPSIKSLVD